MKHPITLALLCLLAATPAVAQNAAPAAAQDQPQNPALKDPRQNASDRPVAGANSFTRGEARSAIEAKGYTRVSGLSKDAQGVWRGKAMKDGRSVSVSVDYQGNVNQ